MAKLCFCNFIQLNNFVGDIWNYLRTVLNVVSFAETKMTQIAIGRSSSFSFRIRGEWQVVKEAERIRFDVLPRIVVSIWYRRTVISNCKLLEQVTGEYVKDIFVWKRVVNVLQIYSKKKHFSSAKICFE